MAENSKQVGFVDDVRAYARKYRDVIAEGTALGVRYAGLYSGLLAEIDMPEQIIPSGDPPTRLESFTNAMGNIGFLTDQFVIGSFDTNFEKICG